MNRGGRRCERHFSRDRAGRFLCPQQDRDLDQEEKHRHGRLG